MMNAMAAVLPATLQAFGALDIVVNNAGTTHRNRPMLEVDEAEFDRIYAVNVKSIFLSARHFVPHFRHVGAGVFVNVASTAAIRPLSLDEKLGRNGFAAAGPIRMGTAFVDRGRCHDRDARGARAGPAGCTRDAEHARARRLGCVGDRGRASRDERASRARVAPPRSGRDRGDGRRHPRRRGGRRAVPASPPASEGARQVSDLHAVREHVLAVA